MIFREFAGPLVLADKVSGITVLQVERLPGEWDVPLVAKAAPSIVFLSTGAGVRLVLYGQNVAPMVVRASGHLTMIAWFLRPHVLGPLFCLRADEVTDLCVELDSSALVREMGLMERLAEAGGLGLTAGGTGLGSAGLGRAAGLDGAKGLSDATGLSDALGKQLRLMEEFVMALCAVARDGNNVAGYAAQVIARRHGSVELRALQEELRVTERSLQRIFAEHVGLSPKVYSRICQFQPAFRQLSVGDFSRLSDIAYDNGYADHSHLIRVFREFTGCTPKEYLARTRAFLEGVGSPLP